MPRRILLASDAVGGVWQYSLELARGLRQRNIDVVLAVAGPPPAAHQRRSFDRLGVSIEHKALPLEWQADDLAEVEALAAWLDRVASDHEVDLLHLNGAGLGDLVSAGPVVVTHHSCLGTWWRAVRGGAPPVAWQWRLERTAKGLEAADAVIAPSQAFAADVEATYPGLFPLHIIYNGRTPATLCAPKEPRVIAVGRLWDEGKNFEALDAAAPGIDWPVVALGPTSPPAGGSIDFAHLRTEGLLEDEEVRQHLAQSSIFVSLARYEPFGLAVLEAAQAQNTLVLADIPVFRELWHEAAVFVDPSRPKEVARAVNAIIHDPSLARALAARAQERAACFTADAMVSATLSLYGRLVGRGARPNVTGSPPFDKWDPACRSSSFATR